MNPKQKEFPARIKRAFLDNTAIDPEPRHFVSPDVRGFHFKEFLSAEEHESVLAEARAAAFENGAARGESE